MDGLTVLSQHWRERGTHRVREKEEREREREKDIKDDTAAENILLQRLSKCLWLLLYTESRAIKKDKHTNGPDKKAIVFM